MKTPILIFLLAAIHVSAAAHAEPPLHEPQVLQPAGTYRSAWLTLKGAGETFEVFAAWRDGKPVQLWSVRKDPPGLPRGEGQPKLLVDRLDGAQAGRKLSVDADLRLVGIWNPLKTLGTSRMLIELDSGSNGITGRWTNTGQAGTAGGEVSGRWNEPDPVSGEWPWFYGAGAGFQAPDGQPGLVPDLAAARPVWRSEAVMGTGWGTGADARYPIRAAFGCICGGASSPVISDGRIFLYHYRPSGDAEPGPENTADLAQLSLPAERASYRLFFSKKADAVVTCLDAATGRTLWEAAWPAKHDNIQTHKWRGNNPTPAVSDGILVVPDYGGGLHAYDVKNGQLLWQREPQGGKVAKDSAPVSPLILGQVVVSTEKNTAVGLDLASGRELWKTPGVSGIRPLMVGGRPAALLLGPVLSAVNPDDGTQLASGPWPYTSEKGAVTGQDSTLITVGDKIYASHPVPGPASKEILGKVAAFGVRGTAIEKIWESEAQGNMEDGYIALAAARGHVFAAFKDTGTFAIDAGTGKTSAVIPSETGHSNAVFVSAGDRLLWQPECQHGKQVMRWIDASPGTFAPLGSEWRPPHNDTTAYGGMALMNLLVDGRLFLRGTDGLYCYDLRAQATKK